MKSENNDKVSYKWSSNIGDWDGYWVDMEYFEEKYGEVEFEGETRDGESLEELQALDEDTRFVEPPLFIDWLIKFQNYGFSVERIWINRESIPDPRNRGFYGMKATAEVTTATVEFSINPNASEEQREKLEQLMQGTEVDDETGTIRGDWFGDEHPISDSSLTGGTTEPTELQGE